jgi:hypothetical protein
MSDNTQTALVLTLLALIAFGGVLIFGLLNPRQGRRGGASRYAEREDLRWMARVWDMSDSVAAMGWVAMMVPLP